MMLKRFYEIDLLRFIAAISVVFYHYGFRGYAADNMTIMPYLYIAPLAKYGYLGVDLFFVISGFVIFMTASAGSARRFLVSRIVRLYPAFWVCCTVTFLVIVASEDKRYSASLYQYAINMTMLSEFFRVKPIDGVYWSLFVEIKFYVLVLLILLTRQINRSKELLGLWLIIVLLISKWPLRYIDFFLIPDFAPYFIAGAMFYLINSEGVCFYKIFIIITSYFIILNNAFHNITSMEIHFNSKFNVTVITIILTLIFIVLFLISIDNRIRKFTSRFTSERWLLLLGGLTYPTYLIHQNIGFIIFNSAYPYLNPHFLIIGTISTILLIAYIIHIKVEKRCSRPMKVFLDRFLRIT